MGPTHSAKQEITETIKFLTWLHETHHRTAATCRQQDIDEWLATGPTTRTKIRTFVVWANKSKINTALHLDAPQAKSTRLLTQDQRLAWIKELLTGDIGITALPCRRHTAAALRPTPDQNRRPAHNGDRYRPARDAHIAWG